MVSRERLGLLDLSGQIGTMEEISEVKPLLRCWHGVTMSQEQFDKRPH
jgi:hypothetical protein